MKINSDRGCFEKKKLQKTITVHDFFQGNEMILCSNPTWAGDYKLGVVSCPTITLTLSIVFQKFIPKYNYEG